MSHTGSVKYIIFMVCYSQNDTKITAFFATIEKIYTRNKWMPYKTMPIEVHVLMPQNKWHFKIIVSITVQFTKSTKLKGSVFLNTGRTFYRLAYCLYHKNQRVLLIVRRQDTALAKHLSVRIQKNRAISYIGLYIYIFFHFKENKQNFSVCICCGLHISRSQFHLKLR